MIKQETLTNGFVRTYSDQGYEIRNTASGDVFLEAVDSPDWGLNYEEVIPETDNNETKE